MEAGSRQPKERETAIPALNAAVEAMSLAEKISTIAPARSIFQWLRQSTSYGDQGMFPTLLQRSTPGLHPAGTRRLMKRIRSSSGYCAPIYAGHFMTG